MESARVYIAIDLTKGIIEVDRYIFPDRLRNQSYIEYNYCHYIIGRDAFLDKHDAIKRLEELRDKRVALFENEIRKLKELKF